MMFQARDNYYYSNKIPKIMIRKWSEQRVIKILMMVMMIVCTLELSSGLISMEISDDGKDHLNLPNLNTITLPRSGTFISPD